MKERPILFSGAMVRAIIEGRKTQTRRVVTPQPDVRAAFRNLGTLKSVSSGTHPHIGKYGAFFNWNDGDFPQCEMSPSPYGKPGDRLWVRETWMDNEPPSGWIYRATDEAKLNHNLPRKWRPSIFMPREACRIKLEITGVRVERVADISEADAKAEGVEDFWHPCYSAGYMALWDSINAKRGYGWSKNPWVWVIEFQRA